MTNLDEEHQEKLQDLVRNRHIPRAGNVDTVLQFVKKNKQHQSRTSGFQYYVIKCQRCNLGKRVIILKISFVDLKTLDPKCNDANIPHSWNRFKQDYLSQKNYLGNHCNVPKDMIELFEDLFVALG